MAKIYDLIKKHCPDGVEFKALWELTFWNKKFNEVPKEKQVTVIKFTSTSAQYLKELNQVKDGDIKLLSSGKFDGYTKEELIPDRQFINKGEIILLPSGGDACVKYYNGKFIDSGNILGVSRDKEKIHLKYIYYYLTEKLDLIKQMYRGAGIKHPSMKQILELTIPLPPLIIQQEIVGILDKFLELQKELQKELELRRIQYEYYRNKLLTFTPTSKGIRWMTLGEVGDVTKLAGYEFTEHVTYSDTGKIIALRGLNVRKGYLNTQDIKYIDKSNFTKLNRSKLYKEDMLFTYVGTIGNVALIDCDNKYYLAPNVARIRFNKTINPRYALHLFQSRNFINQEINKYLNTSSMKNLTMNNIRKFAIPVPPLPEQERIVGILDKFETLVNNLEYGIPAEIKLRQQQYEYYRNKLLNFKQAA